MKIIKESTLGPRLNGGYLEAIKKLRAVLGLTQQALAHKPGVSFVEERTDYIVSWLRSIYRVKRDEVL